MKICPVCNYENPDTNKFCNYCGAQLSGVEPTGGTAPEPDPLAEILAKQKEAAEAQNPVGIGAAGAAGAGIYGAAGQRGQQPGQQGGFQPGAQNGFQAAGQGGYQPGARPAGQHVYRQMGQGGRPMTSKNNAQQYTYSPTPFDSKIPEIAIGKYVAWSVFDILFSLIFGILGLIFVLRINKSKTVEEQQKNLKTARIFLIIGTVFAILNIVFMIAGGLA